jgi:hypothetical protein
MAHTSDTQTPAQQLAALSEAASLLRAQATQWETRQALGRAIAILDDEHDRMIEDAADRMIDGNPL